MSEKKSGNDMMDMFEIEMPMNSTLELADPELLEYWQDYSKRTLWLDVDIEDQVMRYVKCLYRWQREDEAKGIKPEDREPVIMLISSYGGDLHVCYAMIAAMKTYAGRIITVNMGCAYSAAALIFINGTKGYRFCMPYSSLLIHQGSSSGGGVATFAQAESGQKHYKELVEVMMKEIVLNATNIDVKTYNKVKAKENYYYTKDMIELGMADHVVESLSDIWNPNINDKVLEKKEED